MGEFDFSPGGSVIAKLFDLTLGSTSASIDSGATIPGGYSLLMISASLRGDTSSTSIVVIVRFNGDTGNNYYSRLIGDSTSETEAGSFARIGNSTAATSPSNYFGSLIMFIPNYATTGVARSGYASSSFLTGTGSGAPQASNGSFHWANTANPINQVAILPGAGNYVANSRVVIYGLP